MYIGLPVFISVFALILATTAGPTEGDARQIERTPSPPSAKVFFLGLEDGARIAPNTVIRFGASGIEITPAADSRPNSGHHHLLIDTALPRLDQEIPSDFNHLHFGRGQTEVELSLSPGEHTLQLLLGDHRHVPHDPPVMSKVVRVFVENGAVIQQSDPKPVRRLSPSGARVYLIAPHNRAPPHALDRPVPNDPNHLHFGGGRTEKTITLTPGRHTLQLVLADDQHIPHNRPVISERVTVTVVSPNEAIAKQAVKRLQKRRARRQETGTGER